LKKIAKVLTRKYEVDIKVVNYIISNESNWKPTALGDMDIICKRTGKPVEARGLMQITECYHPEITDRQAYNPIFALEWAIPLIADEITCKEQWTTCRNYYK